MLIESDNASLRYPENRTGIFGSSSVLRIAQTCIIQNKGLFCIYLFMLFLVPFQGLFKDSVELATNFTLECRLSFVCDGYMVLQILWFLVLFLTIWTLQISIFMKCFPVPFQSSVIAEMSPIFAVRVITNGWFSNAMGLIQMHSPQSIVCP